MPNKYDLRLLQSQTNKDKNFDISRTTEFFGNLTSDLNSECQKMSENMLFINFPQVIKVVKSLGEFLGHLQLQTNKANNFDISRTTEFFGNLTSDSNLECQKTSENMLFINFP